MEPPPQPVISQKDYLKKYFSKSSKTDKAKKKKIKLSSSSHLKRSQIIDDDLNLNSIADIDDDHFNLSYLGDEAPQIAGVIDERPDSIKALEAYGDTKKWKSISDEPEGSLNAFSTKPFGNHESLENKPVKSTLDEKSELKLNQDSKNINKNGKHSEDDCRKNINLERSLSPLLTKKLVKGSKLENDQSPHQRTHTRDDKSQRTQTISDQSLSRVHSGRGYKGHKKDSDSDESPPRNISRKDMKRDRNLSPSRRNNDKSFRKDSDSDQSPPRKYFGRNNSRQRKDFERDQSPPRRNFFRDDKRMKKNSDSDQSPPRRNTGKNYRREMKYSDRDQYSSRRNFGKNERRERNNSDSDQSPPRKNLGKTERREKKNSDSDQSPPRRNSGKSERRERKHSDSDQSPPRRNLGKNERRERKNSDSDQSPPRRIVGKNERRERKYSDTDQSPSRRNVRKYDRGGKRNSDSDHLPPRRTQGRDNRRQRRDSDSDQSPPRRNAPYRQGIHVKNEPFEERRLDSLGKSFNDNMKDSSGQNKEKSDFGGFKKNFSKMEKTLDGKKAGLQNAKNLREELASLKEEEDKMFKNMDSSKLGLGREAVVRDRKTGRIKDLVKEQEESVEKMQERLAREAKYTRWGKGLKQLEDADSKASDALHEMSKPLARYKDDNDLDAYLKAQEREGDPMLDYIRKKQQESHSVEKLKPRYEGSYGPNRFNIRPGHRWDGVDRSNGYEAKWFESINAKKAVQEEAYKWSSADM